MIEKPVLVSEKSRHDFCQRTLDLKKDIESKFVEFGGMLYEIQQNRYFESGWSSWEEFSLELKISRSTISRLIRIYEVFILKYDFSPAKIAEVGGYTILAELLPEIEENTLKSDVEGWVNAMVGLTREDARKTVTERKVGVKEEDCVHDDTYVIKICRICGERWKVE